MPDPGTIRVVPDTNVLISALLQPLGPSAALLQLWRDNRVELVVCPGLLNELRDILNRPRLRRRVEPPLARALVGLLGAQAELRADPIPIVGLTSDPRDDFIVALARATRADYIVSGDEHLTGLPQPDPLVLTPAQFLKLVAVPESSEGIQ